MDVDMYIGPHLSTSKGFSEAAKIALQIGANTFQFFARNPRGSASKDLIPEDIEKLKHIMKEHNFAPLVCHAPYTINLCSPDPRKKEFAEMVLCEDLEKLEHLPCDVYVVHPGNHMDQGIDIGIKKIAKILNKILKPKQNTMVLLETMSGQGTSIGTAFEELKSIIDKVKLKDKVGVCLDTCHIYSAGYDIVKNLNKVIKEFDNIVGLSNLQAIHINDSIYPLASHKDRHACIGGGKIGLKAIKAITVHKSLKHLPFILETPNDTLGYAKEIKLLNN